ncbi:tyrosine-protein kinase hopscotch [Planococcus citri]|uniref:tyrosine-protein kinase hopscotch n=1 Tax=Planococcus citri TaxID=170843 RepID=UPI0031F99AD4
MNTVNVETHSSNFKINTDSKTTAEDLIIETCKNLKIGPVARHLFAVRIKAKSIWLHLSANIEGIPYKDFEFRMRFAVPDMNRLQDIDPNAYNFCYNQIKYGILRNQFPKQIYRKFKNEIFGLSVLNMFLAIIEDGLSKEDVINDYQKYVPPVVLKQHLFFVKKPLIKALNELGQNKSNYDAFYVKSGYLDQFNKIVPNYLNESYRAFVNGEDKLEAVQITVDPFHDVYPGISMKYDTRDEIEHVCSIDDLCYLNIRKEGTIEISRKNGIPLYLQFHPISEMMSFVSLLDGYYRLMVKWIFNLCRDIPTPSLLKLQPLKCHGPISGEFAYRKLEEKRSNKIGCFILRESDLEYDTYFIDVCTKASTKPVTYKIEMTNNKQYRLCSSKTTYASIPAIIAAHKTEQADFILRECLPPSEFDQSNLLICQTERCAYAQKSLSKNELPKTMPLCIDTRTLMYFKNKPKEGRNQFTTVYRAIWTTDNTKKNVAMKVLRESYKDKYLQEFLSLTNRWAFVTSNAVVKFFGLTLSNPISMVTEYLPMGQLDHYLENADSRLPIKEVDLVEAATYLANALWYLEEAGFVHGNIRCRKVLVSSHTENSFAVKLSDPGLHENYTDADLHWIPPEHQNNNMNEARNSVAADVWAFGTTLWEIFSYGKSPPLAEPSVIRKFYKSGKMLPQPIGCPDTVYYVMKECWNNETDHRKRPQAVMRDINQVLYQVYNARQRHSYTTITPSFDSQQDNVSNKSKESDDLSSSLFSELTVTTFVDDGEERCSADLFHMNGNTTSDLMFPMKSSPQTYKRIENSSRTNSVLSIFSQTEYSLGDNAISSIQSIFELDREWQLILNGRIGEGFHGEVFKGMLQHWHAEEDAQKVAVKKLKTHTLTRDRLADFDREISIMKKLDHPNIVKIKGIIRDPELCLVLEYIDHGSLRCYLNINRDRLGTLRLLKFALDVALGMAYLSEKKIVHRDLAARNILVVNDTHVKISDFGLAQFIGNNNYYQFKTERHLPIEWYAPESIQYGKFSPQSDVWSYGVTLYEMFTHGEDPRLPIDQQSVDDMLNALKNDIRLECPPDCPSHVYSNIMRECWHYEAAKRPTFQTLSKTIEELFRPDTDAPK